MILVLKTDNPTAYIGLYDGQIKVSERSCEAHRELSDTLLRKIEVALEEQDSTARDLDGLVVFKGPGSFTGLRISITVANTLADSLGIPIVGEKGDDWIRLGVQSLTDGQNDKLVMPEYGGEANITKPRK